MMALRDLVNVRDVRSDSDTEQGSGSAVSRLAVLLKAQSLLIFVVLVLIMIVFAILAPNTFAQASNLRLIAQNAAILMVLGVGATFVLIAGGIDLSVGSVLVFSGVTASSVMKSIGGDGWGTAAIGLLVALVSGLLWGLINGLLVAKAKVPDMIVTLATMGIALGISLVLTGGEDIRGVPAVLADNIGYGNVFLNIPTLVAIAAVIAAIGAILLNATRFGLYTRAVGSNAESVKRAGVNVSWHIIKVYMVSGLCAGLAGLLSIAEFSTTAISGNTQTAFMALTAVILGGTSLFGGVGGIFGTVVGVSIPAVLQNGFIITGVQPFWQPVATGCVLIVAVYVDQLRRSRSSI
ncbi:MULTISPECIES: ABC transporter permease [unclassified Mycolicibacterium]|uniref:ABC transporter permease n=1 Tax=unclassified Mycolicibacterium TaxID=2636767 RepID=UPI0012DD588C|nr:MULTISPECIES: ABC transporter permease [unclassified Mycolicibacterium]MUL85658.1 ABC transporter permease [Mycolicibacterium sp. CBMA 329]MUL91535.1 ABC transporter permease [Mycolicibacterium sp. CBMA 331]MUM02225.1 ABC transporter permease [Mycolicibacterium sp. CBMA 334]MUM27316.1 ABC transporter permease [Mycolicibacterium sp. CBMA 295]MUM41175.1 ABC transporter permease [Mycolicibacterium sp. CBMA 247]